MRFSCLQCVPCVLNSPSFLSSLYFLNISADHSSFEQQFLCGTYFTYNLLISPVLCETILNTCIALSLLFARKEIVQHVLRYRRLDIKQRFWIFQLLVTIFLYILIFCLLSGRHLSLYLCTFGFQLVLISSRSSFVDPIFGKNFIVTFFGHGISQYSLVDLYNCCFTSFLRL